MKKISAYSDRELLEQLFANQVLLLRQIYRINDFLLRRHGDDYLKQAVKFEELCGTLSLETEDFIVQYNKLAEQLDKK